MLRAPSQECSLSLRPLQPGSTTPNKLSVSISGFRFLGFRGVCGPVVWVLWAWCHKDLTASRLQDVPDAQTLNPKFRQPLILRFGGCSLRVHVINGSPGLEAQADWVSEQQKGCVPLRGLDEM